MTSFKGIAWWMGPDPGDSVLAPIANFSADDTTPLNSQVVTFTDASTNTPTSWDWDFGDGGAHSADQNPTHTYATPGTYTVVLVATNAGGEDTETKTNYITVTLDPTTITGLQQWLKADAGTYQDDGFATPATVNDAPIGGWQDQSGVGNSPTQGTAGNKPTLKLNIQNGLPVLRFDGGDLLTKTLAAAFSSPVSIFAVARLDAAAVDDGQSRGIFGSTTSGAGAWGILYQKSGTPDVLATYANGTDSGFLNGPPSDANWHAWSALLNGASSQLWIDGLSVAGPGNGGTPTIAAIEVGRGAGCGNWIGDIGEILVYDPSLSDGNRQLVENYLSGRWL